MILILTHPLRHKLVVSGRPVSQKEKENLLDMEPAQTITMSDCSLGTGQKGRSIIAYETRMSASSGLIATKVSATQCMALSSFEVEINGYFESFRTSPRYSKIANVGDSR
jgi:hypothetical protein